MEGIQKKIYEKNLPDTWVNTNYVQEVCLHFLFGYTIYKKKFIQRIPIEFISLVFNISISGMILLLLTQPLEGEILFDTIHYLLLMLVLSSCIFVILKYRSKMQELNTLLDKWFHYKYLEKEALAIRKEVEEKANRYAGTYVGLMLVSNVLFSVAPLIKLYFSSYRSNMLNFLIFPCYLGLPLDTWWGFFLTYTFEIVCSTFSFSLYARFATYECIISMHVNYQLKLLDVALKTLEVRSAKITDQLVLSRQLPHWKELYEKILVEEVNTIAAHLQYLHGISNRIIEILTPATTSAYTGGMWILCFAGVLIYTMGNESLFLVKFFLMVIAEVASVYLQSLSSEYLITAFERTINSVYFCPWYNLPKTCTKTLLIMMSLLVKVPSLRTVVGYKANMENFAAILNASYTYFSLIMAMKP